MIIQKYKQPHASPSHLQSVNGEQKAGVEWILREALQSDAVSIAECFLASYPPCYPYKDFFQPEKIATAISAPTHTVYVITCEDRVVGTASLIDSPEHARSELGRACIHPQYRARLRNGAGESAFSCLVDTRMKRALAIPTTQIIRSTGVSAHQMTQITLEKYGFHALAVETQKYGPLFNDQRETTFVMVAASSPAFRHDTHSNRVISVPAASVPVVERNIRLMGLTRTITTDVNPTEPSCSIEFESDEGSAHRIYTIGTGSQPVSHVARQIVESYRPPHVKYVQVVASVEQGIACTLHSYLAREGYRIAGFIPLWERGCVKQDMREDVIVFERGPAARSEKGYYGYSAHSLLDTIPQMKGGVL